MSPQVEQLIEEAKERPFSAEERQAQRRSFAYGNAKIGNALITREMVDEMDERIKAAVQAC